MDCAAFTLDELTVLFRAVFWGAFAGSAAIHLSVAFGVGALRDGARWLRRRRQGDAF